MHHLVPSPPLHSCGHTISQDKFLFREKEKPKSLSEISHPRVKKSEKKRSQRQSVESGATSEEGPQYHSAARVGPQAWQRAVSQWEVY